MQKARCEVGLKVDLSDSVTKRYGASSIDQ